MKKLLKCVSVFVLAFALMPIVNAKGVAEEAYETGKLILKSKPFSSEEEMFLYTGNILSMESGWQNEGYSLNIDNSDFTKGTISKFDLDNPGSQPIGTKNVTITYEYDEAVKKVADSLIKNLGNEKLYFYLNDIEYLNYMRQSSKYFRDNPEANMPPSVGGFSNEVRKKLNYANFDIIVGMGEDNPIRSNEAGNITFMYNGTFYGCGPMAYVGYKNVIYIPKDAEDIEKAIKDRLSNYFNVKSVSKSLYEGDKTLTLENYMEYLTNLGTQEWNASHDDNISAASQYESAAAYIAAQLALEDPLGVSANDVLTDENLVGQLYDITLDDDFEFLAVFVIRDDEKAKDNRKVITTDVTTGVELTTEGVIPLDVLIQVAKVTSGDEYDKIVKILKNTNVDMFDLKLYSNTSSSFITKLDNGKFKIKLPIKDEFKNKELKVYYVDEDDKVEEYAVTISDDGKYAIFETDHFSIYTLAAGEAIKNPKTGDNILLYVATLMLSSIYLLTRKLRKN